MDRQSAFSNLFKEVLYDTDTEDNYLLEHVALLSCAAELAVVA